MGSSPSRTTSEPGFDEHVEPLVLLTYVPVKSSGFHFSNTRRVYTNDLQRAESLPPPRPPLKRKREIFNPKNYIHVDKKTESLINTDLNGSIIELVDKLTGKYDDDVAKVRALYLWFTSQPVERAEYKKKRQDSTMYQLWHLKHKYINYADFFSVLCWFANVPCVIIRGFLKGSTYSVGQKMSHDSHMGEWNAVLINGQWRLIDTFWGACTVTSETNNNQEPDYSYVSEDGYFLTDPEQLIYSHFPNDSCWQLLKEEKTLKEFESMAVVKERFFEFKMELLSHQYCTTQAKDGKIAIHFQLHPAKSANQTFICVPKLLDTGNSTKQGNSTQGNATNTPKGNSTQNNSPHNSTNSTQGNSTSAQKGNSTQTNSTQDSQTQNKPIKFKKDDIILRENQNGKRKDLTVNVKFPAVGTYRLDILGKEKDRQAINYDYDWIAIYKVHVGSLSEDVIKDKTTESKGFGHKLNEHGLIAKSHPTENIEMYPGPLKLMLQVVDPEKFNDGKVSTSLIDKSGGGSKPLEKAPFKQSGKIMTSQMEVSEGNYDAAINYKSLQGKEVNMCNYHVICKPMPVKVESASAKRRAEIEALRKRFNAGIEARDHNALERAIDEAEAKGYTKELEEEIREARQILGKQTRLQRAVKEIMALDQRTIAEIKSYNHPIPQIHKVMQAVMLLLGHSEQETSEWRTIQVLIGKTGKLGLKRRIQQLNIGNVDGSAVERSQAMLEGVEMVDIVKYSIGVATFYSWAKEVAAAASSKD